MVKGENAMNDLFDVKGKLILITGSSRGLGFAMSKGFVERGAVVVINGTSPQRVVQSAAELQKGGGKTFGYTFDVTDYAAVDAGVARIEGEVGPIDVLVNNAGIHRRAPLEEMSIADFREVIEVDLTSAFTVSQCVAKYMIPRRRGKIINITSLNAEMARPTIGNYCAAKGGLKMLTKSMAAEWGRYGINVNAIGPGYFVTDLTQKLVENPEFDAWVRQEVPLGRWGQPEELIGTAIYLASAASNYVQGHTVYVDGGWQASL
jgi:gluconate 5-dehydrogenase